MKESRSTGAAQDRALAVGLEKFVGGAISRANWCDDELDESRCQQINPPAIKRPCPFHPVSC